MRGTAHRSQIDRENEWNFLDFLKATHRVHKNHNEHSLFKKKSQTQNTVCAAAISLNQQFEST